MKKKAALLLAILALGVLMAACGQNGTSEPAPTATPEATEEPAASPEPASSPEAQQVNQETEAQNTSNEANTELEQEITAQDEQWIQDMMNKWGISREEAEQALQDSIDKAAQAEAERSQTIEERQEEEAIRIEQDRQDAHAERDKFCWENYGTSADHWDSMTFEEKGAWMEAHPMN